MTECTSHLCVALHTSISPTHGCCMLKSFPGALQSTGQLPEAFVVLGFAFYLQPMMMPLLHDMPPGPTGLAITSTAVKIVILGTHCAVWLTDVHIREHDVHVRHDGCASCWVLQNQPAGDVSLHCPLPTHSQGRFTAHMHVPVYASVSVCVVWFGKPKFADSHQDHF